MIRLTGKELKRIAGDGSWSCTEVPDEITHITLHCAGLAQFGAQSTNYHGTISDEAVNWLKLNHYEVEKLTDNYFISWENAPL